MASITKTLATTQSGWTGDTASGGGKQYNDNICRYLSSPAGVGTTFYAYTYGFGFIGTETIDGVYVQLHAGGTQGSPEVQSMYCYIINGLTKRGVGRGALLDTDVASCSGALYAQYGSSVEKWGLTQANLNTYVRDSSNFGISIQNSVATQGTWWVDGFSITVYYTPVPTGWDYTINEVSSSNLGAVNEVLRANIAEINKT